MSNYPDQATLEKKLQGKCTDKSLCTAIAKKFGGAKISCNHGVAQRGAFEVGTSMKADKTQIANCTDVLIAYVDQSSCKK